MVWQILRCLMCGYLGNDITMIRTSKKKKKNMMTDKSWIKNTLMGKDSCTFYFEKPRQHFLIGQLQVNTPRTDLTPSSETVLSFSPGRTDESPSCWLVCISRWGTGFSVGGGWKAWLGDWGSRSPSRTPTQSSDPPPALLHLLRPGHALLHNTTETRLAVTSSSETNMNEKKKQRGRNKVSWRYLAEYFYTSEVNMHF